MSSGDAKDAELPAVPKGVVVFWPPVKTNPVNAAISAAVTKVDGAVTVTESIK